MITTQLSLIPSIVSNKKTVISNNKQLNLFDVKQPVKQEVKQPVKQEVKQPVKRAKRVKSKIKRVKSSNPCYDYLLTINDQSFDYCIDYKHSDFCYEYIDKDISDSKCYVLTKDNGWGDIFDVSLYQVNKDVMKMDIFVMSLTVDNIPNTIFLEFLTAIAKFENIILPKEIHIEYI